MKKKLISLLLVVTICLSMGTVAFAEDTASLKYQDKAEMLVSNSNMLSDIQVAEVESGLAAMEQVNVPIGRIFNVSSCDGKVVYHRQVTEDIINYLTVDESANGDVVVDYYEGDLHDTVTYCADGTILLNGHPVIITYTNEDGTTYDEPLVTRNSLNDVYTEGPCSGTKASDYTVFDKTRYGNLQLEQQIIDIVTSTLCDLLTNAIEDVLTGFVGFATSTVVGEIFDLLCSNIKTKAQRIAPTSDAIGYKVDYYTTENLIAPLCYCYRHDFDFYLCPVKSDHLPDDMYVGARSVYHLFTLYW